MWRTWTKHCLIAKNDANAIIRQNHQHLSAAATHTPFRLRQWLSKSVVRCEVARQSRRCIVTSAANHRPIIPIGPKDEKPNMSDAGTSTATSSSQKKQDAMQLFDSSIDTRYILTKMLSYLWPQQDWKTRGTVLGGFALLTAGKGLSVYIPVVMKNIVDSLQESNSIGEVNDLLTDVSTASTTAGALILTYFGCRAGASGLQEIRRWFFAPVLQNAVRKEAKNVFLHLHELDLKFHLAAKRGALQRVVERGTKSVTTILNGLVYLTFTAVEFSFILTLLTYHCGPQFAALAVTWVILYSSMTKVITTWRNEIRRRMNSADNAASAHILDSLANYETVKYFNNDRFEAERYDDILRRYQKAWLKTEQSLAMLNFAQNIVIGGAVTLAMYMAYQGVLDGSMTVGDLVMVNGLLIQLSIPLNFMGSQYRETLQAVTDMNSMFSILSLQANIKESSDAHPLEVTPDTSQVEFSNVTFMYQNKVILDNLSFTVPAGKKVALVGESGSGWRENNYSIKVPIFKHFHKNIIGKRGSNIKKIKEETSARIDSNLPRIQTSRY